MAESSFRPIRRLTISSAQLEILDGFAGALPESQVREFLGKHNIQPAARI